MNINNNLTENDIDRIDVNSQLEHQIQIQETEESGWIFDEINSMTIRFYKTGELNGSSYVKYPLRSNALINLKTMINTGSFGQFYLVFILVKLIILIEFQIINNSLMN